jgi:hypothetical protein
MLTSPTVVTGFNVAVHNPPLDALFEARNDDVLAVSVCEIGTTGAVFQDVCSTCSSLRMGPGSVTVPVRDDDVLDVRPSNCLSSVCVARSQNGLELAQPARMGRHAMSYIPVPLQKTLVLVNRIRERGRVTFQAVHAPRCIWKSR